MLNNFLSEIYTDIYDAAHDAEHGGLRSDAVLAVILQRLTEAGVTTEPQVAYLHSEVSNMVGEVHGYEYDSEEDTITLYFCIEANEDELLEAEHVAKPVAKESISKAFRRLESFVKLAKGGMLSDIEESQPVSELVNLLGDSLTKNSTIELVVITTGTISEKAAISTSKLEFKHDVWDLNRLAKTCGTDQDEKISIDLAGDYNATLPCLVTEPMDDGIQVFFACIPGTILADIYNKYRSHLLERNVRSFLQLTGKVNKGILDTLITMPERFLPYNNGLSATASSIEITNAGDGTAEIKKMFEFQIVNGGQTTATIALAARKRDADLSKVSVAMKITVIPASKVEQIVPSISRYANTQNRIQEADFSANHPWHIAIEQFSRSTWTSPSDIAPRGTRWFYERARGQYRDEASLFTSQAGKRRFSRENPNPQKLSKTDVAKYILSWDQMPYIVSMGAQKCFMEFMNILSKSTAKTPQLDDFQRIIAYAILFKSAEKLYGELDFTGYRAQVVTYSLARFSHALEKRLPHPEIWKQQNVPDQLLNALKILLIGVREVIVEPPSKWRNVTEWAKRKECWAAVLEREFDIELPDFSSEHAKHGFHSESSHVTEEHNALIEAVSAINNKVWFSISKWAKDTSSLQTWQRSIAFSIGRRLAQGQSVTLKQANQAINILQESMRLGFKHEELSHEILKKLKGCVVNHL